MEPLTIYCIPGMGVNERLFKNLKLNNCTIKHIKWLEPNKNESLQHYALRLSAQIDTSKPFCLIGVSFGGMCATEISKILNPVKTFLVSSSKTRAEVPAKIKLWNKIPLYKLLNDKHYINGALLLKKQFGVSGKEQSARFLEMLQKAPTNYFKGAVHCIVNWKNKEYPTTIVNIHGNTDQVLPHHKINADYTIDKGSHFMIINRADEINAIINNELKFYFE